MSYYFMVLGKKGEYIPLDIPKSKYFARLSNSKGKNCSLNEIDAFTTLFFDENELREALLKEGILPLEYAYKELTVRRLSNGKYHKVMYDFLYQKDIEYLMDPMRIIRKADAKLRNDDFRFVQELTNHFYKYHDCSSTLPEVRDYTNMSIMLGQRDLRFNNRDVNNDTILVRMLKLIVFEYKQDRNGKLHYSDKVKYANLHNLIAFVNNYDKKYINDREREEQYSLFKEVEKPKKKMKIIPGQIGFSDIIK